MTMDFLARSNSIWRACESKYTANAVRKPLFENEETIRRMRFS